MKIIILAISLLSVLPMMAAAEEAAAPAEHTMKNSNPAPKPEVAKQPAAEHVMSNSNPAPKQEKEAVQQQPAAEHVMKNK